LTGASVNIAHLSKAYGAVSVLSDIDLKVEPGEFLTLLGPSGCGKSTLLRLIAGFENPNEGTIEIGERPVDALRPKERGLSMVFQNYALYPHLSVYGNISMPLVMRRMGFWERFPGIGRLIPGTKRKRAEIRAVVTSVASMLEIDGLLDRKPGQLSGGQRQRVALGRAIAPRPSVFLMDEPLSNLDARLRLQMRGELIELHRRLGITFIYVTHDQIEAMTMSQRVAVMMDGRIVQVGKPSDIYRTPADLRVATFIGTHPINVCPVHLTQDGRPILFGQALAGSREPIATIAFRPEDASLDLTAPGAHAVSVPVTAEALEDHGGELVIRVRTDVTNEPLLVTALPSFRHVYDGAPNRRFRLSVPLEVLHFFDRNGKRVQANGETREAWSIGLREVRA
jgi:multiple sugar transport system ATP-binding protein